jgi:molecular chaperone GrpE
MFQIVRSLSRQSYLLTKIPQTSVVIPSSASSLVFSQNRRFSDVNHNKTAESSDAAESASNGNNNGEQQQESKQSSSESENVTKLQSEIKSLKDAYLRAYADAENTRRIAAKDIEIAREYANTSFAKAMLDIADDLERALATVPLEKRSSLANVDPMMKTLIDGIEMTDKNLQKVFRKFGVVKYGNIDEKFDPNIHEALYRIPDTDKPDTVGAVVKLGYKLKDRVLRPAQVGARVKPDN